MTRTKKSKKSRVRKSAVKSAGLTANKTSITNILVILLIISLNWAGLSVILGTSAYLSDMEFSQGIFSMTMLDFSLESPEDFSPGVTATTTSSRSVLLVNNGILGFDYVVSATSTSGVLCDYLTLSAKLDGSEVYNGSISGFNYDAGEFSSTTDEWYFTASSTSDDPSLENESCDFGLVFDGVQAEGPGFSDQEIISNTITYGVLEETVSGIVINEFLPNPVGDDDAPMPGGEWIELYNNTGAAVDVAGWWLYDAIDSHELAITDSNTDTGGTIIPNGGFLVVYRNGDSDFSLNNTGGDTVRLYNGEIGAGGNLIDSYSYTIDAPEGKSFARIPDGSNNWVDPIPTPGGPNVAEEGEIAFGPAVSEPDEEIGDEGKELSHVVGSEQAPKTEELSVEEIFHPAIIEDPTDVPEEEPADDGANTTPPSDDTAVGQTPLNGDASAEQPIIEEEQPQVIEEILPVVEDEAGATVEVVEEEQPALVEEQPVVVEEIVIEPEPVDPPVPTEASGPAPEPTPQSGDATAEQVPEPAKSE